LSNFGFGIVHVARDNRVFGTDVDAGGFETDIDAVGAVVALGGGVIFGVDIKRVIRAGLHARFAANAAVFVKIDDAIIAKIKRFGWANFHARRVGTVVATHHRKQATSVGKLSFFDLFDPRSVNADGDLMLTFTSSRASMAADALAVVDDESVFHKKVIFRGQESGVRGQEIPFILKSLTPDP
jgi:hypothetical protein